MFVLVTLLACVMGWVVYSLNWIRQRNNPTAHGIAALLSGSDDDRPTAPGFLWIFGEDGFDRVQIVIDGPADPQNPRRPLRTDRTPDEHAVRDHARSLFPEARIEEISFDSWRAKHSRIVQPGMTFQQVRECIGEPDVARNANGGLQGWYKLSDGMWFVVEYEDSKVISVGKATSGPPD